MKDGSYKKNPAYTAGDFYCGSGRQACLLKLIGPARPKQKLGYPAGFKWPSPLFLLYVASLEGEQGDFYAAVLSLVLVRIIGGHRTELGITRN